MTHRLGRPSRIAALVLSLLPVAACGDEDAAPPELALSLSADGDLKGFAEVRGTVTFAGEVPPGKRAHLVIGRGRPTKAGEGEAATSATASQPATKLTYAITRLATGNWSIFAWVDLDGDGRLGPGDLSGYYAGTTSAPAQLVETATILNVGGTRANVDFGLGAQP